MIVNLFSRSVPRTRTSFEIAAKRLVRRDSITASGSIVDKASLVDL